jgi:hypothetical protein
MNKRTRQDLQLKSTKRQPLYLFVIKGKRNKKKKKTWFEKGVDLM